MRVSMRPMRILKDLGGFFDRRAWDGLRGSRGGDYDDAYQDEEGAEDGAGAEGLAAEEIADEDGHHGVDVGVGADLCWRFVMNEPDVGGEADDRAGDDEISQRPPHRPRDG